MAASGTSKPRDPSGLFFCSAAVKNFCQATVGIRKFSNEKSIKCIKNTQRMADSSNTALSSSSEACEPAVQCKCCLTASHWTMQKALQPQFYSCSPWDWCKHLSCSTGEQTRQLLCWSSIFTQPSGCCEHVGTAELCWEAAENRAGLLCFLQRAQAQSPNSTAFLIHKTTAEISHSRCAFIPLG